MPPRGRLGSLHVQAEDIFAAFQLFDTNRDGFISRSEFVRILTKAVEGCKPLDEEQAIILWNDFLLDVGAACTACHMHKLHAHATCHMHMPHAACTCHTARTRALNPRPY